MTSELTILKTTLDLASAKQSQLSSSNKRQSKEFISFNTIAEAFKEVCGQLELSNGLEQRCYQVLLLMSADKDGHLTWWEKVHNTNQYLAQVQRNTKKFLSSPNKSPVKRATSAPPSSSSRRTAAAAASSSSLRSDAAGYLMRLTENTRLSKVPHNHSMMSPTLLHEGVELSMLLNNRSPSHVSHTTYFKTSPTKSNTDYNRQIETPSSASKVRSRSFDGFISPQRTERHIHFQEQNSLQNDEVVQYVHEKVDSIEQETKKTRNLMAKIAYRQDNGNRSRSNISFSEMGSTPQHNEKNQLFSPVHNDVAERSDIFAETLKYDIRSPDLSPPHPPAINSNTDAAQRRSMSPGSINRLQNVDDFSKSLRSSNAMKKYNKGLAGMESDEEVATGEGKQSTKPGDVASQYASSTDKTSNGNSGTSSGSHHHADNKTKISVDDFLHGLGLQEDDNAQVTQQQQQRTHTASSVPSSSFGNKESRTSPLIETRKIAKEVITSLSSGHNSSNQQQPWRSPPAKSSLSVADLMGHDNQFNPQSSRSLSSSPMKTAMTTSDGLTMSMRDRHVDLLDKLSIDISYFPSSNSGDGDYASAAVSSMKILCLFEKWVLSALQQKRHRHLLDEDRILPLLFYTHFSSLNNFVSSLFGLEQWLREKMKDFIVIQSKEQILHRWRLYSGVSSTSRLYYYKRCLRKGFERWLECKVKYRLRRKNALHAYAWRREHVHPLAMSSNKGGWSKRESNRKNAFFTEANVTAMYGDEMMSSLRGSGADGESHSLAISATNRLYSSSLAVRDLLHSSQHEYNRLSKEVTTSLGTRQTSASSIPLHHAHIGIVKHQQYRYTQDLISMLFAFRRLFHRTIYIPLYKKVHLLLQKKRLFRIFTMWKSHYQVIDQHRHLYINPKVELTHQKILRFRKTRAFWKLYRNIGWNQRDKLKLTTMKERIAMHRKASLALHMIRAPSFVRCFMRWKELYIEKDSISSEETRIMIMSHLVYTKKRKALWFWRQYVSLQLHKRGEAMKRLVPNEEMRKTLLGTALSAKQRNTVGRFNSPSRSRTASGQRSPSPTRRKGEDFAAADGSPSGVDADVVSRDCYRRSLSMLKLKKYLWIWRSFSKQNRVFFSLLEMKFAYNYSHQQGHNNNNSSLDVQAVERRKHRQLLNRLSCRVHSNHVAEKTYRLVSHHKGLYHYAHQDFSRQLQQHQESNAAHSHHGDQHNPSATLPPLSLLLPYLPSQDLIYQQERRMLQFSMQVFHSSYLLQDQAFLYLSPTTNMTTYSIDNATQHNSSRILNFMSLAGRRLHHLYDKERLDEYIANFQQQQVQAKHQQHQQTPGAVSNANTFSFTTASNNGGKNWLDEDAPPTSSVPVGEYLQLLAAQQQQKIADDKSAAMHGTDAVVVINKLDFAVSPKLAQAVRRWYTVMLEGKHRSLRQELLRSRHKTHSLTSFFRLWRELYQIQHVLHRHKKRTALRRIQEYTILHSAIITRSAVLSRRYLLTKRMQRWQGNGVIQKLQREQKARFFYNVFLSHIFNRQQQHVPSHADHADIGGGSKYSGMWYFLTHSHSISSTGSTSSHAMRNHVPFFLRQFLQSHPYFRFANDGSDGTTTGISNASSSAMVSNSKIYHADVIPTVKVLRKKAASKGKRPSYGRSSGQGDEEGEEEEDGKDVSAVKLTTYLLHSVSLYLSYYRAFRTLHTRALLAKRARFSDRIYRRKHLRIAFHAMHEFHHYGKLRRKLRIQRLRILMMRWKENYVVLKQQHTIMRHILIEILNKEYRFNVYKRVWDRAWGVKIQKAWSIWLGHTKDYLQRAQTITNRHHILKTAQHFTAWQKWYQVEHRYKTDLLKKGYCALRGMALSTRLFVHHHYERSYVFRKLMYYQKFMGHCQSLTTQQQLKNRASIYYLRRLLHLGLYTLLSQCMSSSLHRMRKQLRIFELRNAGIETEESSQLRRSISYAHSQVERAERHIREHRRMFTEEILKQGNQRHLRRGRSAFYVQEANQWHVHYEGFLQLMDEQCRMNSRNLLPLRNSKSKLVDLFAESHQHVPLPSAGGAGNEQEITGDGDGNVDGKNTDMKLGVDDIRQVLGMYKTRKVVKIQDILNSQKESKKKRYSHNKSSVASRLHTKYDASLSSSAAVNNDNNVSNAVNATNSSTSMQESNNESGQSQHTENRQTDRSRRLTDNSLTSSSTTHHHHRDGRNSYSNMLSSRDNIATAHSRNSTASSVAKLNHQQHTSHQQHNSASNGGNVRSVILSTDGNMMNSRSSRKSLDKFFSPSPFFVSSAATQFDDINEEFRGLDSKLLSSHTLRQPTRSESPNASFRASSGYGEQQQRSAHSQLSNSRGSSTSPSSRRVHYADGNHANSTTHANTALNSSSRFQHSTSASQSHVSNASLAVVNKSNMRINTNSKLRIMTPLNEDDEVYSNTSSPYYHTQHSPAAYSPHHHQASYMMPPSHIGGSYLVPASKMARIRGLKGSPVRSRTPTVRRSLFNHRGSTLPGDAIGGGAMSLSTVDTEDSSNNAMVHIVLSTDIQFIVLKRVMYNWNRFTRNRRYNPYLAFFHSNLTAARRSLQKLITYARTRRMMKMSTRYNLLLHYVRSWVTSINRRRSKRTVHQFVINFHMCWKLKRYIRKWFRFMRVRSVPLLALSATAAANQTCDTNMAKAIYFDQQRKLAYAFYLLNQRRPSWTIPNHRRHRDIHEDDKTAAKNIFNHLKKIMKPASKAGKKRDPYQLLEEDEEQGWGREEVVEESKEAANRSNSSRRRVFLPPPPAVTKDVLGKSFRASSFQ